MTGQGFKPRPNNEEEPEYPSLLARMESLLSSFLKGEKKEGVRGWLTHEEEEEGEKLLQDTPMRKANHGPPLTRVFL